MLRIPKILMSYIFVYLFFSFEYAFAQQYCIYQRDFNQWLCNNVRGAQQACYAPDYASQYGSVIKFPDYNSCENARRSALPSDMYWQRMTRCVPCGQSELLPHRPQYQQESKQSEEEKVWEKIRQESMKEEIVRKEYIKVLKQEKEQKDKEFKKMVSELSIQMKTSPPPINPIQKDEYKKALEQAYCSAYTSIKAAEMALRGNFEVSRNLMTNLENMRATAGQVFDGSSLLASCPKPEFNISDVGMSIERDPRYIRYTEIVRTVQALIPKIETNFKELQRVREKKKQAEQKIKEMETEIEQAKQKNDNELEAKARALLNQAEAENREALKKEQELLKEKLDIENKLAELKNKILAEEKR